MTDPSCMVMQLQVISKFEIVTLSVAKSPLLPEYTAEIPPRRLVGMTFLR
jgi:hypothetical protein